jgi:hypothetical protein
VDPFVFVSSSSLVLLLKMVLLTPSLRKLATGSILACREIIIAYQKLALKEYQFEMLIILAVFTLCYLISKNIPDETKVMS